VSQFPSVKPKKISRLAEKLGFVFDRQKGSHAVYYRSGDQRRIVIPMHNKDLKPGTLRGLISDMGLSVEEFKKIY
jgi:predicted RNA binding protein YcfA (HicA-like mRNA interferase family)